MVSRLFEHCVLLRYSDVIHVNCYDKFEDAMNKINKDMSNLSNEFPNHIRYTNVFKYHPRIIKKFIFNREFDVEYKYISLSK